MTEHGVEMEISFVRTASGSPRRRSRRGQGAFPSRRTLAAERLYRHRRVRRPVGGSTKGALIYVSPTSSESSRRSLRSAQCRRRRRHRESWKVPRRHIRSRAACNRVRLTPVPASTPRDAIGSLCWLLCWDCSALLDKQSTRC